MVGRVTGRVVDVVDPNAVLDHIDINALLDRVDIERLLARIDLNALLARVDFEVVLGRIDLDALLRDMDVESVVRRSGIPDVVADTTRQMAGSTLDLARRQVAGLDFIVSRTALRLSRRSPGSPAGPVGLIAPAGSGRRRTITGLFAGPVARGAAVLLDAFAATTLFTAGLAGVDLLARTFLNDRVVTGGPEWAAPVALVAWLFVYLFASVAISGRTLGKGAVGLRVVRADGEPVRRRAAFIRAVTYPWSFLLLGLGLSPILFGRQRRALHDRLAGTAVVFDFGDRPAELPTPLSRFLDEAEEGRGSKQS